MLSGLCLHHTDKHICADTGLIAILHVNMGLQLFIGVCIPDMSPKPLPKRLPTVLQFPLLIKQDSSLFGVMWQVWITRRQDHWWAISALLRPPGNWRRPRGCPCTIWLRETDADVRSANINIHLAWMKANHRVLWQWTSIVKMATFH